MTRGAGLLLALLVGGALPASAGAGPPVVIGSKKFTESYVLGEIARLALARAGIPASHRQGMGGTIILWQALRAGEIGFYPEYTGTISEQILKSAVPLGEAEIRRRLAPLRIGMTSSLGFEDTYALVMRRDRARALGIRDISDLAVHPDLALGFSHEFLGRRDGWGPLARRYGLSGRAPRGIDHTLAYAALAAGQIDVTDAYSTDARLAEDHLEVLRDDRRFFPQYEAVFLYRLDADPRAIAVVRGLTGTISRERMSELNAAAERMKDYTAAARLYFGAAPASRRGWAAEARRIGAWTLRHLELVGLSLLLAVLAGVPLGIRASRPGPGAAVILGAAGIVQTIPALALLALLVPIPWLGISARTAIAALFLYGLLPIVRSTATGLREIPPPLRESAAVLGLSPSAELFRVLLPMASPQILAGIRISAVINVGGATLAALIGAGGLGEPIISGLNLNDGGLILEGALPAALLALAVEGLFALVERAVVPRGLRLSRKAR